MESMRRQRGIALISVIIMVAFLAALAATMAITLNVDTQLRGVFGQSLTGFYAAESGLNKGMGDYKDIFLNFRVPTGSDFNLNTLTMGTRTVNYQLQPMAGASNPQTVTIPAGQLFAGLNAIQYLYVANSKAVNANSDIEASVGTEFLVGYIPLFQFIAFYANDLEILPGPDMHLHGRVHTNGDLYLNSENNLYVEDWPALGITTVQVSAKGNIYRGRKDRSECHGTVTVDKLQDIVAPAGDLDPQVLPCNGSATRQVPVAELATWKGSMVSQLQSISVPAPDATAKGSGVYWTNADLRIVLNLTKTFTLPAGATGGPTMPYTIEAQDAAGATDAGKTALLQQFMYDNAYINDATPKSSMRFTRPLFYSDIPTCANALTNPNNFTAACYAGAGAPPVWPSTGMTANQRVYATTMTNANDWQYRRGGFYNQREQEWIMMLNINLHDLFDWNSRQASGSRLFDPADNTDGGIVIYATVQGPNSLTNSNGYGVRIFGSAFLPFPAIAAGGDPTGVTFVSDQAVYVQGDYNSVAPKQPAAIMGDSVNILSNNYFRAVVAGAPCANDCQSNEALASADRNSTTTTINSAFLGGVDNTVSGTYNGGLENYFRFHEDWSGTALNYRGSFVSLGTPLHVNGLWCGTGDACNIYNPPNRNYDYDPDFNDVRNLPPLTPRFVYVQQVLFTEDFK